MKKIIVILFLGILTGYTVNAQKEMDKFQIQVDGLGCPFCAYGLEKKFKEFKGIKNIKIDIETGDFSFTYPTEKALGIKAIIAKVKKAGYTQNTDKIIRANGKIESSENLKASLWHKKLLKKTVLVVKNYAQNRRLKCLMELRYKTT